MENSKELNFSSSKHPYRKRGIPKDPPSYEEIKRMQEENKRLLEESRKAILDHEKRYTTLPTPPPSLLPPMPPPKGGKRYRKTAKRTRIKRRHAKKTRGWFW